MRHHVELAGIDFGHLTLADPTARYRVGTGFSPR